MLLLFAYIVCFAPRLPGLLQALLSWPLHKLEFHISLIKIVCARRINVYNMKHLFRSWLAQVSLTTHTPLAVELALGERLPKIMQHNIIVTLINDLQNHKSNTASPYPSPQWFPITKTGNSSAKRLNYNKTKCPGT